MRKIVTKLGRFNYTIHNVVAHPLSEVFHQIGFTKLGDKIHDITLPIEEPNEEQPDTTSLLAEWCKLKGLEVPWDLKSDDINEQIKSAIENS